METPYTVFAKTHHDSHKFDRIIIITEAGRLNWDQWATRLLIFCARQGDVVKYLVVCFLAIWGLTTNAQAATVQGELTGPSTAIMGETVTLTLRVEPSVQYIGIFAVNGSGNLYKDGLNGLAFSGPIDSIVTSFDVTYDSAGTFTPTFTGTISIRYYTELFCSQNAGCSPDWKYLSDVPVEASTSITVVDDSAVVPLPASAWMLLASLGGVTAFRRKSRRSHTA